jgi:serine/threonine protein kinase
MFDHLLRLLFPFRKHFKPLKRLGSGSFGEVHLVKRRSTKQLYVTKTVKKKFITRWEEDDETGTALPAEVAYLQILVHPNIGMLHSSDILIQRSYKISEIR